MSKESYIPPIEDCPNCPDIESTECVNHVDSIPELGIGAGSSLKSIIKDIAKNFSNLYNNYLKRVVYNVDKEYEKGLPIFTYTTGIAKENIQNMNIPLFMNGKYCFEYDRPLQVSYTDELAYNLFFNYTDCGVQTIADTDIVKITTISGVQLPIPILIKDTGETNFSISDINKVSLISQVNSITNTTFTDIITDTSLSVYRDLSIGFVFSTGTSTIFLNDLTYEYTIYDSLMVEKEVRNGSITNGNVTGLGIESSSLVNFSVDSVGGQYSFIDSNGDVVTDEQEVLNLENLVKTQEVRNICCTDCIPTGIENIDKGEFTFTNGIAIVSLPNIQTASIVTHSLKNGNGVVGAVTFTITPGVGITFNSDNSLDNSTYNYIIITD